MQDADARLQHADDSTETLQPVEPGCSRHTAGQNTSATAPYSNLLPPASGGNNTNDGLTCRLLDVMQNVKQTEEELVPSTHHKQHWLQEIKTHPSVQFDMNTDLLSKGLCECV